VGPTLFTQGNLNNEIGVPLTLLRLQDEAYAVIEMGANHAGEIGRLSRMALPEVALLNNAGAAHLEGFGSLEGVARAKAEIVQGLRTDGVFVYNADDRWAGLWRELAQGRRTRTFGIAPGAEVRSPEEEVETRWDEQGFRIRFPALTPEGRIEIDLHLGGRHNRMNALAAVAACQLMGADAAAIAGGLAALQPVKGRLRPLRGTGGMRLIDDSYNANPDSVAAAIGVLAAAPGRRFLVLGDLAELGSDAGPMHARLGEQAREAGLDHLYGVGPLTRAAVDRFGPGGRWFEDRRGLIDELARGCGRDDFLLVKGSRASRMDEVVSALADGGEG
jgi:UDP-N-acetylmuramoyl-tripeptide--D-alanyl-D-alanine ligase